MSREALLCITARDQGFFVTSDIAGMRGIKSMLEQPQQTALRKAPESLVVGKHRRAGKAHLLDSDGSWRLGLAGNPVCMGSVARLEQRPVDLAEESTLLRLSPADARGRRCRLIDRGDDAGSIVGVVPLLLGRLELKFNVAGRVLGRSGLSGVTLLGSLPLLPTDVVLYDGLFDTISRRFSGCGIIRVDSVPTDSPFWRYLQHSQYLRKSFFVHVPDGIRQCHMIPLPATFEDYLGQLKSKKRYNIKRQIRLLRTHGEGRLELRTRPVAGSDSNLRQSG